MYLMSFYGKLQLLYSKLLHQDNNTIPKRQV
jgi:hypothetical protein